MSASRSLKLSQRPGGGPVDLDFLKRKSWPGVTAQFVRIAPPNMFDFRLTGAANCFALCDIYRVDGETRVPGLPRSHIKDLRNKITFLPTGCDIEGWSKISKSASFVAVYLDQSAAERERIDLSQLPPSLAFDDQMLRSALARFQAILHDPSLDLPGYAETLATMLTFEMARLGSQPKRLWPHQGGLTARQVRLITDYIEGRLDNKTTVAEMAALLNLSRFHFIRAFKKSVGMPPHQFIMHRRIERAKELLADARLSVSEVAEKTGFNSVTQLARTFRHSVGTTPTLFRRNVE